MAARKQRVGLERSPLARCVDKDPRAKIAKLAKVPDAHRQYFFDLVSAALQEARRAPTARHQRPSTGKIREPLKGVESNARALKNKLLALDQRATTSQSFLVASKYLGAALNDKGMKIRNYLDYLGILEEAAQTAAEGARMPKGRPGDIQNPFDAFIFELLDAVHAGGGNLTIYKSSHAGTGWDGTLLKAVDLLKPLLPERFVPSAAIGSSLHRISQHRKNIRAR
jgi:hypothetical protein